MERILFCVVLILGGAVALQSNQEFNANMLWGTYKPQLIHAISQRRLDTYNPLTLAFMYFDPENVNTPKDIFYKVPERRSDQIKYLATHSDGYQMSVQDVIDPTLPFNFNTAFLKVDPENFVDEVTSTLSTDGNIGLIYTFAFEQANPDLPDTRTFQVSRVGDGIQVVAIEDSQKSYFYLQLSYLDNQLLDASSYNMTVVALKSNPKTNWDARTPVFGFIEQVLAKPNQDVIFPNSNLVAVVITASKGRLFSLQVQYSKQPRKFSYMANFQKVVAQKKTHFESDFQNVFGVKDQQLHLMAMSSFSQLMQGLQFTFGDLLCVQDSPNCKAFLPMLSHTPSRYGFPRPFLWDEGFHNQVSCWFRQEICLQSLTDWIHTMSEDGWIPREQPRGDELRSYIPGLYEDKRESNPPTFFFNIELLINNFGTDEKVQERLANLYTQLQKWYTSWFDTQSVKDESGNFSGFLKWWGPSEEYNLGSGMDDWPRSDRYYISKYNVDAQAWGYFLSEKMLDLTKLFAKDQTQFIALLEGRIKLIKDKLYSTFLDPTDNLFKDVLQNKYVSTEPPVFSPHKGYPNLIPLAMGLIDPSNVKVLQAQLDFMSDENAIWSEFGLRSLDFLNEFFGVDSNYWRGPIWINVHYLVLRGLKLYHADYKPGQEFYARLRDTIVNTVNANFQRQGYFFEHYNQQQDGFGRGNHPFNGWTSTITLIVSEKY